MNTRVGGSGGREAAQVLPVPFSNQRAVFADKGIVFSLTDD